MDTQFFKELTNLMNTSLENSQFSGDFENDVNALDRYIEVLQKNIESTPRMLEIKLKPENSKPTLPNYPLKENIGELSYEIDILSRLSNKEIGRIAIYFFYKNNPDMEVVDIRSIAADLFSAEEPQSSESNGSRISSEKMQGEIVLFSN